MKLFPILLAGLVLLPSCETTLSGDYVPEYMRPDSPLDPPGTSAARAAMRAKRVKKGKFETGSTISVQEGRVFLLTANPDYSPEPSGTLVDANEARIMSCEGLYYFVELDGGQRGYLRESDLVQPVELVPTDPMMVMGGDIFAGDSAVEGAAPVPLNDNQTLTTNEDGRAVVLVGKKTERSAEFEQRKKEVEGQGTAASDGGEEPPPLPEPAAASGY